MIKYGDKSDRVSCSAKFSRRIIFAVFTDSSQTAKIKHTNNYTSAGTTPTSEVGVTSSALTKQTSTL